MAYTKGWQSAAARQFMDLKFTEYKTRPDLNRAYEEGCSDGRKASKAASEAATRIYDYKPTILRAT